MLDPVYSHPPPPPPPPTQVLTGIINQLLTPADEVLPLPAAQRLRHLLHVDLSLQPAAYTDSARVT